MRRFHFRQTALGLGLALAGMGAALAAPPTPPGPKGQPTAPGLNKLLCFDGTTDGGGYGGTCVRKSNGAKGPATLTVTTLGTDYAGVYTQESTMYGQALGEVRELSFQYTGTAPGAGAPRFSVPIDLDGDGSIDQYAFISAYYCNNGAGLVDAIRNQNCTIWLGGVTPYANWSTMAAALPSARVATNAYVFLVADEPGTWTVSNVQFGKTNK